MTRAERLAILGEATVSKIHRRVAAAPPPPPELIETLRDVLAPALMHIREQNAAAAASTQLHAA